MLPAAAGPLWWLAPPPLPRWEACHWIFGSRCSPYKSSSFATPASLEALWMLGSGGNLSLWQQRRENHTTGLRPRKCTPFGAAHHFPRRGKFALRSAACLISISKRSAARISPSGGDAATGGRRGVFPRAAGAVVWFSLPKAALPPTGGNKTHRPQVDTTTLSHVVAVKPKNLKNPRARQGRQPSRRRRVQWRYYNPRAKGPSNLRTLAPTGRINLKNLSIQPFYTTCRRQAAQPLRLQAHQPGPRSGPYFK